MVADVTDNSERLVRLRQEAARTAKAHIDALVEDGKDDVLAEILQATDPSQRSVKDYLEAVAVRQGYPAGTVTETRREKHLNLRVVQDAYVFEYWLCPEDFLHGDPTPEKLKTWRTYLRERLPEVRNRLVGECGIDETFSTDFYQWAEANGIHGLIEYE